MNASRSPPSPLGSALECSVSPAELEPGIAPAMDQKPFRRNRKRDLALSVTGLEPLPDIVPAWERTLIERALVEALQGNAPKDAPDARPQ